MDCSPPGSSVHEDFPGKNTGVGCHYLLQVIFLTQELNLHLLLWQADPLPLSHHGSPAIIILSSPAIIIMGMWILQTVGTFNILTQEYSIQKKWVFVFVCVCFDSVRAILKVVWKERNYTITGTGQTKKSTQCKDISRKRS